MYILNILTKVAFPKKEKKIFYFLQTRVYFKYYPFANRYVDRRTNTSIERPIKAPGVV